MVGGKAVLTDQCVHCGACIDACAAGAIRIAPAGARIRMDVDRFSGICVFVEATDGCVANVSLELLGKARALAAEAARRGPVQTVTALVAGATFGDLPQMLVQHGADHVVMVRGAHLGVYHTEMYTDALTRVLVQQRPEILLFGATAMGRDLAPRIANRLQTGLTADCTAMAICPDEGILLQSCPAFGGNVMATIVCPDSRPQITTVRPGVMTALPADPDRRGTLDTVDVRIDPADFGVRVTGQVRPPANRCRLTDAKIIVAGGRGVKGPEGFALLGKLADTLGAELGATRGAVDAGWIGVEHQVGQTGETVQPDLYIACGLSGAIQHLTGMIGARYIISINKDKDAPINQIANDVFIGDLFEIVPLVTKKLAALCGCSLTA